MSSEKRRANASWSDRKRYERGRRALERQRQYQRQKADALRNSSDELVRSNFLRCQALRQRLDRINPIGPDAKVLEVGSGAHGLIFGFGAGFGIGVDPLATEYKKLFPSLQNRASTIEAIGEELPFADGSFDVVISDNVIDHADRPLSIVDELIRVVRTGGLLYFTVNVHHPIYEMASKAHGLWNALGIKLELSAFADHTVHLTEEKIAGAFEGKPLKIVEKRSTIAETRSEQRRSRAFDPDSLLKKAFFKNAIFEIIAVRT